MIEAEVGAGAEAAALGALLRGYRRAAGLTQEGLAERAGVSRRGLQHLEAGDTRPYLATLEALAGALALGPADRARLWAAVSPRPTASGRAGGRPAGAAGPARRAAARPGPTNLPLPLTSFVGRERALTVVRELIAGAPHPEGSRPRLVTLTGAGGVGKTRLALQAAATLPAAYPGGVWLVELGPLADPALVPPAVAAAVGVREQPGRPLLATLAEALRPRRLLLVLDNCEHLLESCAALAEALLRACPEVRLLATSREALGAAGEVVWRVPSLETPDPRRLPPPAALARYEAVRLFVERAVAVRPDFALTTGNAPAVAEVCRRLDGIPLALELAAARVRVLPAEQIARLLGDRFRLLTGGARAALPRHRTLRALVDWSYDLLEGPERALLRRLSVFAGGWTLAAAQAVGVEGTDGAPADAVAGGPSYGGTGGGAGGAGAVLDGLTGLVDKSLVQADVQAGPDGTEARYRLLETIRLYGQDRLLEAGEAAAARDRHLAWCLRSAERWHAARPAPDGRAWRGWLWAERDNLRAALGWSLERDPEAGLRLLLATANYLMPWSAAEDVRWLDRLLARAPRATAVRGRALLRAADMLRLQGRVAAARGRLEECEAVVRALGGVLDGLDLGRLWLQQAQLAAAEGDVARTRTRYDEALAWARASGDLGLLQGALSMGLLALGWGDPRSARLALEECLSLARAHHNPVGVAGATIRLGIAARLGGDVARAHDLLQAGLRAAKAAGSAIHLAAARAALGDLARQQGDAAEARAQYRALLAAAGEHDDEVGSMAVVSAAVSRRVVLCHIGVLAIQEGAPSRGVRLLGAALPGAQAFLRVSCPDVQLDCETALTAAQTALGESAAAAAWREGLALTLEQAVAHARDEVEGTARPRGEAGRRLRRADFEHQTNGGLVGQGAETEGATRGAGGEERLDLP